MSNAPNGSWQPRPVQGNPGSKIGWRLLHSWWLLLPIFGFSCLGGAGFVYVGIRAKRPAWWITGIVYLVVGWATFITVGESNQKSAISNWAIGVFLAMWVGSIVHACLINSTWLRWLAGYVPWYAQPAAPPPTWPGAAYPPPAGWQPPAAPTSGSPLPPGMAPQPDAYYWARPPASPVPPSSVPSSPVPPEPAPVAPQSPAAAPAVAPSGPLDVNTATYEQLAALPGFAPDRAQRVLAERQSRRGFLSVEEFAAVANLAPHEFAQLRSRLVCAPPQQQGPTNPWGPPPQGRVLDV